MVCCTIGWVGSRAQFVGTAKEHRLDPLRLERYFRPIVYGHYFGAERYDKFDIWKMMADNDTVTREFGRLMERFDLLAGADDGDPASQGRWTLFAAERRGARPAVRHPPLYDTSK